MTSLQSHLRQHWHHHLSVFGTLAGAAVLLSGVGAGIAVAHQAGHGGVRNETLAGQASAPPPQIHIPKIMGGPQPVAWYLGKDVVRIHNQGSSNSCVGQTLATIEEITQAEHHRGSIPFSAGYIYDQINGGVDEGASYQDAFTVLTGQGDAPLSAFPHDGIDFFAQPDLSARSHAYAYRFQQWRSIAVTDRYTIAYEIAHGRPLALVMPWHDALYNQWGNETPAGRNDSTVWFDYGTFHFWHSVTIIGYNPTGVRILNSWGPAYGQNGRVTIAWPVITAEAGEIVASNPVLPTSDTDAPAPVAHHGHGALALAYHHPDSAPRHHISRRHRTYRSPRRQRSWRLAASRQHT